MIKVLSHYKPLYNPSEYRYFVYYGGRGSSKSWGVAQALLVIGSQRKIRVLCTREIQGSIKDSVLKLLKDLIDTNDEFSSFYAVTNNSVIGRNGTEFIFEGLYSNITKIKSMEGIDYCWVEEAEAISVDSWETLDPTIRKENSKIIITFNPYKEDDPIYDTFIINTPDNAYIKKLNYNNNPKFPEVLRKQMEQMKERNYQKYLNVWEGETLVNTDALIFKDKFIIKEFQAKHGDKNLLGEPLNGLDFGFARDPTAVVACYVANDYLYIYAESGGIGIEIDKTYKNIDKTVEKGYKIRADNARPESISFIRRQGYNIEGVKKWKGSVEDGIEFIKGFKKVIIHPRCVKTAGEFSKYSYVIDKRTKDVLPKIEDKHNHYIDAIRYAIEPLITRSGEARVFKIKGF